MNFTNNQVQFIREQTVHVERTKAIPDTLLDFIYEKRLFKLLVSESLGGRLLELPNALRIFQDASYAEGNFGWLVTIGSGGGMFSPNFEVNQAKNYFTPNNAVIAGSGFPAGKAEKADEGYIVNGEWKYSSGSEFATLFTANCVVEDGEATKVVSFILNTDQVHVKEDWDAFGLKGTSSHTIQVVDQFVPAKRTFSIFEIQNDFAGSVHQFPFVPFSEASFASIVFGIGRHYLEEAEQIAIKNKDNWQQGEFDRYRFVTDKLKIEQQRWEAAETYFYELVEKTWHAHKNGQDVDDETWEEFSLACKQGATTVITCAQNLFRYMGMECVMEHSELNRIWRDLQTAAQHAFLIPYKENEASFKKV
ncbi:acyl-CoA dehydrogenase family protein [Virgibacillus litoralis]|uniref:Alkylation response protein AidB-like acyl-CoA dehydrogenase n=1 Tax=Virgibacillus litoralis TaxID=578221 RepID=A0ABS4HFU3_9BACI|nr:acyl-CoA dehydrogenase [Virgibacillus litoralis]MBP1949800.1 alkylation response protein AidB-like acyl-CoA dehydrogenase [Virgibacillus litoralis]